MDKSQKIVMIYGPELKLKGSAYGGGEGGYVRNMRVYLSAFDSEFFKVVPSFHTVRGVKYPGSFVVRFTVDLLRIIKNILIYRPMIVHVLGGYRMATPREFMVAVLCKCLRIKLVYEIKAGAFINWYNKAKKLNRFFMKKVLLYADAVLAEGRIYLPFIRREFDREAVYFPNVVPDAEIPTQFEEKLRREMIRVLFVGYCYEGKGVYELVEACEMCADKHQIRLELTLVGKEEEGFSKWLEARQTHVNLKIIRIGVQDRQGVMKCFESSDIYCYPSSHEGEGHNNSINEAMMMGMVIVSSRAGFLEDVLGDGCAYLLDEVSTVAISDLIVEISNNPNEANQRAKAAYDKIVDVYSTSRAKEVVTEVYQAVIANR